MKKHVLIGVALVALTASSAGAADTSKTDAPATVESSSTYHEWTLEEARQHAHEKADKLDKMTEAEWKEKQAKHHAWYEKWKNMTPEQKVAYKKAQAAKRHAAADASTAPVKETTPSGSDK